MRCPFRMKGFDQPDTCDPECAWAIRYRRLGSTFVMCSVAAIAAAISDEHGDEFPWLNYAELDGEES